MRDEQLALLPALQRMGLLLPNQAATFIPLTGGVSSLIVKVQTETDCFCVKRALPQLKVSASLGFNPGLVSERNGCT